MTDRQLLVFTDLDGTLLDHHTYRFQAASPALERLREAGIPVILNSSKTRPEMESLQQQLGIEAPFIVENGAAAIIPAGNLGKDTGLVVSFSAPLDEVHDVLRSLRQEGYRFRGFMDMDAAEVAAVTGLPHMAAARAKQRIGTEPLLWEGSADALTQFQAQLQKAGLQLIKGGRFYHAMGQYDKADAMQYLVKRYQSWYPEQQIVTIALGDSPNDARMLESADYAVIIKGVNSDKLEITGAGVVLRSQGEGPVGWNECIQSLLKQLL